MNAKELAEVIHGREYTNELSKEEERQAKESGLVVVFGASDDLLEFRGAIHDELDAYGGTTVHLSDDGRLIKNLCDDEDCPYFAEKMKSSKLHVRAEWGKQGYSWTIESNIPHEAAFTIMEDGETYCRGIVYQLA